MHAQPLSYDPHIQGGLYNTTSVAPPSDGSHLNNHFLPESFLWCEWPPTPPPPPPPNMDCNPAAVEEIKKGEGSANCISGPCEPNRGGMCAGVGVLPATV